jgi:hypothetical protein
MPRHFTLVQASGVWLADGTVDDDDEVLTMTGIDDTFVGRPFADVEAEAERRGATVQWLPSIATGGLL